MSFQMFKFDDWRSVPPPPLLMQLQPFTDRVVTRRTTERKNGDGGGGLTICVYRDFVIKPLPRYGLRIMTLCAGRL